MIQTLNHPQNVQQMSQSSNSNALIELINAAMSKSNDEVIQSAKIGQSLYIISQKSLKELKYYIENNKFTQLKYTSKINAQIIQQQPSSSYTYYQHVLKLNISQQNQNSHLLFKLFKKKVYKYLSNAIECQQIQIERRLMREKGKLSLQLHPYSIEIEVISINALNQYKNTNISSLNSPKLFFQKLKVNLHWNETIKDLIKRIKLKINDNFIKAYAYDSSLFQQISFERMVQYYFNKENLQYYANKDQQNFYKLQQSQGEPTFLLQFFPGKLLINQSVNDIKKMNISKIILQTYNDGCIFPKQPQFSTAANCKFCMMRMQLYINFSCQRCNKKYLFCSEVCHYQFLLQHRCKDQAQQQIFFYFGQQYLQQNTNHLKINTQSFPLKQLEQTNHVPVDLIKGKKDKEVSKKTFGGGLTNIGNTCYLNASLQNLIRTSLSDELISLEQSIKMNNNCKLTKAYLTLINKLKKTSLSQYISYQQMFQFKMVINRQIYFFDDQQQHDAHQFIMFFLDRLSQQLNFNRNIIQPFSAIQSRDKDQTAARKQWFKFVEKNNSPIIHLFYGQIKTQIDCPHCHTINQTFASFNILSISIPNSIQFYTVQLYFETYQFKQKIKFFKIDVIGQYIQDLIEHVGTALNLPIYKRKLVKCFIIGFQSQTIEIKNGQRISNVIDKLGKFGQKQNQLFLFQVPLDTYPYLIFKFLLEQTTATLKKPLFFKKPKSQTRNFTIYQTAIDYLMNLGALYMNTNQQQRKRSEALKKQIQRNIQKYFTITLVLSQKNKKTIKIPIQSNTEIQPQLLSPYCQLWVHIQNFSTFSLKDQQFYDILKTKLKVFKKITDIKKPIIKDVGQTTKTIQQCLKEEFNRKELLDNENKWHCSTCNEKRRVHQITHLYKTNKYLFIHLKRFTKGQLGDYYKNQSKVKVALSLDLATILKNPTLPQNYYQHLPQQTLKDYHLPNTINTKQSYQYKLIGLILHKGNIGSGHYTALFNNSVWFLYNDQQVTPINIQDQLKLTKTMEKIYILLYQRIS